MAGVCGGSVEDPRRKVALRHAHMLLARITKQIVILAKAGIHAMLTSSMAVKMRTFAFAPLHGWNRLF